MSAHKCCKSQKSTLQVRQRYIPTFVHEPIFVQQLPAPRITRNTPTFYSTVLDTQGYNIKTTHHKNVKEQIRPNTALQKSVYINQTHQKRVEDLNPQNHVFYSSRDKWFDHTKQEILQNIKDCRNHGYSKQRKYVDLSSDPVFTDYIYGLKGNLLPNTTTCIKSQGKVVCSAVCCKQNQIKQHKVKQQPISINNQIVPQVQQQILPKQCHPPAVPEVNQVVIVNSNNKRQQLKSTRKDFHKNCIPEVRNQDKSNLKLKGHKVASRPQTAQKSRIVSQKPTFTVIRKSRIAHS